jgi:hypothetical protein
MVRLAVIPPDAATTQAEDSFSRWLPTGSHSGNDRQTAPRKGPETRNGFTNATLWTHSHRLKEDV